MRIVLGQRSLSLVPNAGGLWAWLVQYPLGLEDVEHTAVAIAGGDLSRRVPQRDPRTEVGRLSLALNQMLGQIETAFAREADRNFRRTVAQATPLGRWGRPEDVAAAALWLASPGAAFLTGQSINVNGGVVM